jgi:D-alanyl-D-alanine carboxypeptidase
MKLKGRSSASLPALLLITGLLFLACGSANSKALPASDAGHSNGSSSSINSDCRNQQANLQRLLDKAVAHGFPGIALGLYQPECGATQLISGKANLTTGAPMVAQEHFRIASCSKVFLGVVVMQLVSEGKVSLSDPIAKYISQQDAANIENADRATIRQLMNHTTGIYDYFDDRFNEDAVAHPGKYYNLEEALKFAYGQPAAFSPPGSGYYYSNTDTILLAVMVEKVTQAPFTQALRQRIFNPLHLKNTYNDYAEPVIEPLAHGYEIRKDRRPIDHTDINQGYGLPDGGIVSDAADMATFIRALLHDGKLLTPDALKTMLTIDPAAQDDEEGLNIFIYSDYLDGDYGNLIGHSGEIDGYKSEMYYFPDEDVAIVLLTNSSGNPIDNRWEKLFDNAVRTIFNGAPSNDE